MASDKGDRFTAIVKLGKKLKKNHAEAGLIHSPKCLYYILQLTLASIVITSLTGKKTNLLKLKSVQMLLRNRSSSDFIKFTRNMIDPALYYSLMSPDEEKVKDSLEKTIEEDTSELDAVLDSVVDKKTPSEVSEDIIEEITDVIAEVG